MVGNTPVRLLFWCLGTGMDFPKHLEVVVKGNSAPEDMGLTDAFSQIGSFCLSTGCLSLLLFAAFVLFLLISTLKSFGLLGGVDSTPILPAH